MNIRTINQYDIEQLREIHRKYYACEFSFDDFAAHYLSHFAVTDENDRIISAGGIRSLAEIVLMTDKSYSVRDRRDALYRVLQASMFACNGLKYDQLHAFIQDPIWLRHLQKVGFKETKGKAMVLCL